MLWLLKGVKELKELKGVKEVKIVIGINAYIWSWFWYFSCLNLLWILMEMINFRK